MLSIEADLKSTDDHVFKVTIYLVVHLPVFVRVRFQDFPSRMDKDSSESKGRGTLLHVIKREPKAWVSSLKEFMELALKLSNHLITTGPKLKGNTLHIRVLSLEWIAIVWLN